MLELCGPRIRLRRCAQQMLPTPSTNASATEPRNKAHLANLWQRQGYKGLGPKQKLTPRSDQTDHLQIDHDLHTADRLRNAPAAAVRGCAGYAVVQTQTRKHVLL